MSIMEQLQGSGRAAEYISLFGELLPLGMLSFTIAFIAGLYRLRLAPLLRQPARLILTVVNTLLYSAITAFMAVSAVMMLPYVIPDPSAKLEVGVLIMVTLCGCSSMSSWLPD